MSMNRLIDNLPETGFGDFEFYPSGEGCELALYRNVSFDMFKSYTDKLVFDGYELVNENEIENNFFKFLKADGFTVSLGYYGCDSSVRIVVDTNKNFPDFNKTERLGCSAKTTIWQFEVDHRLIDCGMCYIIRTQTGAFFIIDSAHTYSVNDCERIHTFLRERTPAGEKIHIAGWFFSHGHEDHIAQFINYLAYYMKDTVIDKLYYNFIDMNHRDGSEWMQSHDGYIKMFDNIVSKHPEIPVVRLHTGQSFYVDNLKFDVLCSHEDVFPDDNSNYNDSSVVLMMTAEGTKFIIPGDAGHVESYILEARYPDYLKADIVQQSHHGHFGTTDKFYRLVDADIALFPVTQIKFDEELDHWSANRVSLSIAKEYYIASNGTIEIDLPYEYGNVKVYPDETFESFEGVYNLWSYEYTSEYKKKLYEEYLERGGKPLDEYKNGF